MFAIVPASEGGLAGTDALVVVHKSETAQRCQAIAWDASPRLRMKHTGSSREATTGTDADFTASRLDGLAGRVPGTCVPGCNTSSRGD